ncbi:MAG: phosphoenolpyruvate carboxykinase (ATP) [Legionellales bacterium]|nr:phosphoenolpyruvate carboxykinase (ATP) [Legionellales bacterium]
MQQVTAHCHVDCDRTTLLNYSFKHHEGVHSAEGVLTVETGTRTGRSPQDRFIVQDELTRHTIDWGGTNQPIDRSVLTQLWARALSYLEERTHFINHLRVGASGQYGVPVKVTAEYAWHAAFALNMFIDSPWVQADHDQHWSLMSVPGLTLSGAQDGVNSDGVVILDCVERRILICGIRYAGEMKKAMFTALNYHLPDQQVLPMHCAANVGEDGSSALFFGLSGTGKTTLSSDPARQLVGDDEHGWSDSGVFNFEGGCYAKCINLSQANEPVIWDAIRPGAIMENVILDSNGYPDFTDVSKTQNTRVSYPLFHVKRRVLESQAAPPNAVIFLACDLYGVLPPVSLLSIEQAAYYFLSGYTALVGSTEMGQSAEIKPTFSTCFGAPFFSRPPQVYADLLMQRLNETQAQVFLVNTGWHCGGYASGGQRYSITTTRAIIHAITAGVDVAQTQVFPKFNFKIPSLLKGVESALLDPRRQWSDESAYWASAHSLIEAFQSNFKRFSVSDAIIKSGPTQ